MQKSFTLYFKLLLSLLKVHFAPLVFFIFVLIALLLAFAIKSFEANLSALPYERSFGDIVLLAVDILFLALDYQAMPTLKKFFRKQYSKNKIVQFVTKEAAYLKFTQEQLQIGKKIKEFKQTPQSQFPSRASFIGVVVILPFLFFLAFWFYVERSAGIHSFDPEILRYSFYSQIIGYLIVQAYFYFGTLDILKHS